MVSKFALIPLLSLLLSLPAPLLAQEDSDLSPPEEVSERVPWVRNVCLGLMVLGSYTLMSSADTRTYLGNAITRQGEVHPSLVLNRDYVLDDDNRPGAQLRAAIANKDFKPLFLYLMELANSHLPYSPVANEPSKLGLYRDELLMVLLSEFGFEGSLMQATVGAQTTYYKKHDTATWVTVEIEGKKFVLARDRREIVPLREFIDRGKLLEPKELTVSQRNLLYRNW